MPSVFSLIMKQSRKQGGFSASNAIGGYKKDAQYTLITGNVMILGEWEYENKEWGIKARNKKGLGSKID